MRNNNISERIKLVLSTKKLSIRSFARSINCADTTIGAILRDKAEPSYSTIYSIIDKYPDISTEWLLTGEGDMLVSEDRNSSEEFYANHIKEITRIILKKLENYAESTPIESILTSVCTDDSPQKARKIQQKITQIKSKN